MTVTRRGLLAGFTVAGAVPAPAAAEPAGSLDALRQIAAANGAPLTDDRLRVLQPILERRQVQLRTLRSTEVEDRVAPTPGILDHGGF